METLYYKRVLLNPLRYGAFAWKLFSHKVCRWLAPWAALAAFLGVVASVPTAAWARWVVGIAAATGGGALVGWWWPSERPMPGILALPTYLVVGNVAALDATIRALRGELTPVWEPTRRAAASAGRPVTPSADAAPRPGERQGSRHRGA